MMARAGIVVLALLAGIAAAFGQDRIHLHTNETEVGEVLRDGGLLIEDPLVVFDWNTGTAVGHADAAIGMHPDDDFSSNRGVADRILDQVPDGVLDGVGVAFDRDRLWRP